MTIFTFTFIYCVGAALAFSLYAYELYKNIRPMPFKSFRSFYNALAFQSIQPIWPQFIASLDEVSRKQIAHFFRWRNIAGAFGVLLFAMPFVVPLSKKILNYWDIVL